MGELSGKHAIVCGSTQGIGLATATALADLGAHCVLVARNRDRLDVATRALPPVPGAPHQALVADFGRPAEVRLTVEAWLAQHGPAHILINNTGGPKAGPIVDATPDEFTAALASHLLVNHLLAQAVIPGMRDAGYGRIVNVISTSVKQPLPNLGVSNTTRAAVAGWAKTLANEVGRFGITVNNVLPGATQTGRLDTILNNRAQRTGESRAAVETELKAEIPMGRFGTAEEIAAAIAFLASPRASYITGVSLAVDGGRTGAL